jgi:hypothetical protein
MARNTSLPDTIPRPRMRFHLIFDLTGDFGNSKNGVIWTSGDSVIGKIEGYHRWRCAKGPKVDFLPHARVIIAD